MADVVIADAELSPNPVKTNAEYTISVRIVNRVHGILTKDGKLIMTKDGSAIERKRGEG